MTLPGTQNSAVRPAVALSALALFAVSLLAFALLAATAHAQSAGKQDDPAVAACDAVIRHEFPISDVKRLSAEVAKDKVTVVFSTAASAMIFTRQCVFAQNAATQTWIVRELVSPRDTHGFEATGSCHETESWAGVLRRGGKPDRADLARSRLEECATLMRAPPDRRADVAMENTRFAVRKAIPVAAGETALRQP